MNESNKHNWGHYVGDKIADGIRFARRNKRKIAIIATTAVLVEVGRRHPSTSKYIPIDKANEMICFMNRENSELNTEQGHKCWHLSKYWENFFSSDQYISGTCTPIS